MSEYYVYVDLPNLGAEEGEKRYVALDAILSFETFKSGSKVALRGGGDFLLTAKTPREVLQAIEEAMRRIVEV